MYTFHGFIVSTFIELSVICHFVVPVSLECDVVVCHAGRLANFFT